MATPAFCKLIDQICQLANIPSSPSFYETADLEIDEIQFTLIDCCTDTKQGLVFFCDFGLPPERRRAEVLQRLLELNLIASGIDTPAFSVNDNTGHVVLIGRIFFEKKSALDVLNTLVPYAAQATEWQKTRYLQESSRSRPPSSSSGIRHVQNRKFEKSSQ